MFKKVAQLELAVFEILSVFMLTSLEHSAPLCAFWDAHMSRVHNLCLRWGHHINYCPG
jgi:hypothetical protein